MGGGGGTEAETDGVVAGVCASADDAENRVRPAAKAAAQRVVDLDKFISTVASVRYSFGADTAARRAVVFFPSYEALVKCVFASARKIVKTALRMRSVAGCEM